MYFIGVCGASGSGKTTVCKKFVEGVGVGQRVAVVTLDSFYKSVGEEDEKDIYNYNFDHPNAFDFEGLRDCLRELEETGRTRIPTYSFVTHKRTEEVEVVENVDIVVLEGILILHDQEVRAHLDLSIFVDTDLDTCLVRRIRRDTTSRGRSVDSVLTQYEKTVKPSFDSFIAPLRKYADVIIPRGGSNHKAIEIVTQHIIKKLETSPELKPHDLTAYRPLSGLVDKASPTGSPTGSPRSKDF
eukprot:TRINITY_DN24297_c0_g1_i1.p1 TRINITY_DN24297_c0_g1~~TRINITY_DN24297_c0_g1_i1.p1  ORF type:complete len:250 (+),score=61.35 TRINITY_DN24297_c0_g1_i1:27-752(+)